MNSLLTYIVKRILIIIPSMFAILIATFILSRFLPGDPVVSNLPTLYSPEQYTEMEHLMGLDRPILEQLGGFLKNFFTGNWGKSNVVAKGMEVTDYILQVIPRTLELAVIAILLVPLISIRIGTFSANHRNSWKDSIIRGFTSLTAATPTFVIAMMLQYFANNVNNSFGWEIPIVGMKSGGYPDPPLVTGFRTIDCILANEQVLLIDTLTHLIMPVIAMTFTAISGIARQTRSSMLEILEQDYIRTARAKGCSEEMVQHKHALKNALMPVTIHIGLTIVYLITGSIMVETVFNYKGMGTALFNALQSSDYWVLNGLVLVMAMILLFAYFIIDILYVFIDPRVKYE